MTMRANELRVADLMTRAVQTLSATQSLPLAESMMGLLRIRHIPVVDDARRVVGLVTHRDLLAAKISVLAPISDGERSTLQLAVPVSRIMKTDAWTIAHDALALSAARIMREHRFGCLPVVAEGRLVGIVTESDLLALVTDSLGLHQPASPPTMAEVMTVVPITITPDTTLAEARAAMSRYGVHHLPVVDGGHPIALVCERDLAVAEAVVPETERASAAYMVRMLGRPHAHRVSAGTHLDAVLRDMLREHLDAVVVVDADDRLVGIFTNTDACRLLADGITSRDGRGASPRMHDTRRPS